MDSPETTDRTVQISQLGTFEVLTETGDGVDIGLYDSPGYGDFINNQESVDKIKKNILERHTQWRSLDAQSMTEAEFLQADDRIHCVFYFISAHRMKEIDREFITQLSPIVPIVPIISKADAMTVKERNLFISTVKQKLDALTEKFGEACIYDFQGDDLTIDKSADTTELLRLPNVFAIVCDGAEERVYPWGRLSIDSGKHSDFRRVQMILFESGSSSSSFFH